MGKLGQLLVARGWITVQQLTRALQNQNAVGGRLGTCLLEMEVLGEDLLARSLSEQLGVPAAVIEDLRGIPDEVLRLIPEKLARRCRAIPFRVAGGRLDVAMQDPRNLVCQDEIAFACGRRVKVHVLHELRIFEALQRYYREETPSRYALLLDRLNRARYLWGGKEGGPRPAPGTPVAQVAQGQGHQGTATRPAIQATPTRPAAAGRAGGAPDRAAAGDRREVLSSLPAEDLLSEQPRFQPPPLPEPALPPTPRRRSLFRSRGATPAAPAGADAAGMLPPLEELDLRGGAPRRQRGEPDGGAAATASQPPAAPTEPPEPPAPLPPPVPATSALPAIPAMPAITAAPVALPVPSPVQAVTLATAGATPGQHRVFRPSPPDLEATLTLGPPQAAPPPRPAAVTAPREAAAPRRETAGVPHEIVAVTAAERAELGLDETQPALAPESPREAPATLEAVEEAFAATTDSEEVGRILLGFLAHGFRRVALFQATRDHVSAWMAHGDGIDQEAFGRYAVSFKEPSVFLNLRQGNGIHIGPLPPMATHRELALCWGGGLPRDCVVLPVRLMNRLVSVIYMDGGSRGLGGIDLEQMHRLTAATANAFERCILGKKRGYAQS